MIKKRFKEYFTFTRKERNGVIVLLFIIFLLIIVNTYLNNKSFGKIVLIDDKFQKEVDDFEKSLTLKPTKNKEYEYNSEAEININESEWTIPDQLFEFDPNTILKNDLEKLGFSKKQISVFLNLEKREESFIKKKIY